MIQSSWQIKKLSEIGTIFNGNSINERVKNEKYFGLNEGFPFIATKDVDFETHSIDYENGVRIPFAENNFKIAHKNSILVCAEGGSAGKKVAFNERDICFGNKLFALEAKAHVAPKFVYYWYLTDDFANDFKGLMNGLIGGVSMNNFKTLQIPLPPLPEQLRIVSILDEALGKLDQAKENIEKNLKNAKEVFESYLQSIFANPGEDWDSEELGNLGTITSSKRIFKSEYTKSGVPFYRTKEIKEISNGKEVSLELFISRERYLEIKKSFGVPRIGDLLLSAVGTIGEIMVIKNDDEFYFKDGNILWFKDFDSIDVNYLKFALTAFVEKIKSLAIGAAYSALTIEKLNKYKIYFPKSLSEQKSIILKLDTLSTETKRLESIYEQKLAHLDELRKSLLKKAFSGEL